VVVTTFFGAWRGALCIMQQRSSLHDFKVGPFGQRQTLCHVIDTLDVHRACAQRIEHPRGERREFGFGVEAAPDAGLVGRDDDMRTILHESGHAFHTYAARDLAPHFHYRGENAPVEFAEVASMSMELLGGEHIEGTFYDHEDAIRSKHEHLESIVRLLAWIATIDAFQHWIYTNPDHTTEERERSWMKLRTRFGGAESWDDYDRIQRSYWQRQGHLFTAPFYYIEYGIAQLGALGIWTQYRKNPASGMEWYKKTQRIFSSLSEN